MTHSERMLEKMRDWFLQDNPEEISKVFETPLPIYRADGVALRASRSDTNRSIKLLLAQARISRVVDLEFELISVVVGTGGQEKAHTIWRYLDNAGAVVSETEVNYYSALGEDSEFRIQMVEYIRVAFKEVTAGVPVAGSPGRPN